MSSSSLVLFLLAQVITLAVLVELLVRCMPPALRRLSESNSYRPDGMISENRKSREVRAKHRLRIVVALVLLVPCMAATVITLTFDRLVLPVEQVIQAIGLEQADEVQWQSQLQQHGVLTRTITANEKLEGISSLPPEEAFQKLRRAVTIAKSSLAVWALLSALWVGLGLWWAYRGFEKAATARQQKNLQHDRDRMSGKSARFTIDLPAHSSLADAAKTESQQ